MYQTFELPFYYGSFDQFDYDLLAIEAGLKKNGTNVETRGIGILL